MDATLVRIKFIYRVNLIRCDDSDIHAGCVMISDDGVTCPSGVAVLS